MMRMISYIPTSPRQAEERFGRKPLTTKPLRLEEWRGASGRQYQHLVYGLVDCPALPVANYVLTRRSADGRRAIVKIGRTSNDAPTLNLAKIRHEGAQLGANEVHIHVMARSESERAKIEFDISAGVDADATTGVAWH